MQVVIQNTENHKEIVDKNDLNRGKLLLRYQ